jgi:iron complex transport system ATP-binding protein
MEVLELVRRRTAARGLTTLLAIHDLNAAVRCADRLVVLHGGRIRAVGRPVEVLSPTLLAEVYGVEAFVERGHDGLPVVTPVRALRRSTSA